MTVGSSSISFIKPGRGDDAIAGLDTWKKLLTAAGAQNVRSMLLMNSTPLRLVMSWEAADQAAMGKVNDAFMADPAAQAAMRENSQDDSPVSGYMTDTWIEI